MAAATSAIEAAGSGYIIYLRDHEGRGIGLSEKIAAYRLQDGGMDTVDANLALGHQIDERDWNDAIEILKNLGLQSVSLLSHNPLKAEALRSVGIEVNLVDLDTLVQPENREYLLTKKNRLSHTLTID